MLSNFYILAFTHRHLDLNDLGELVLSAEERNAKVADLKASLALDEVFYISTCNRVEVVMLSPQRLQDDLVLAFLKAVNPGLDSSTRARLSAGAQYYEGLNALEHLIRVSCSLESMVVGEKEILAQVRAAYQDGLKEGLTADSMRLIMNCVVKAAKEVYSHTKISEKPVSVVSLAYRKLRALKTPLDARMLIIGAGKTVRLFSKYLVKHGYKNFTIFNRTPQKAETLAAELRGRAYDLASLPAYKEGFDVLLTCTGAVQPLISSTLYEQLLGGEREKKIVIDLSIPNDIDAEIANIFPVHHISVKVLQEIAIKNMEERQNELSHAEHIIKKNVEAFKPLLRQRKIELEMREVPRKIREIRAKAIDSIFAKELESMDEESRKTLDKVLNYMEKKYISVPMLMAKEILVNT